jgi:hypothetical protein
LSYHSNDEGKSEAYARMMSGKAEFRVVLTV